MLPRLRHIYSLLSRFVTLPLCRPLFSGLFILSLILSLGGGSVGNLAHNRVVAFQPSSAQLSVQPSSAQRPSEQQALAQQVLANELVEQGVERYRDGDFLGAIAPWSTALDQYQVSGNLEAQGVVLENLARAYGRLGRANDALPYWTDALVLQQQLGHRQTARCPAALQQKGRLSCETVALGQNQR